MADGVKVELAALSDFAKKMGTTADAHLESGSANGGNLSALAQGMRGQSGAPSFESEPNMCHARNGFLEAQDFATLHSVISESAMGFMTDALSGLASLGAGAETCAIRYAGTDAMNAADLRGTSAGEGDLYASLAVPMSGTATDDSSVVVDAFTPATKTEALIVPATIAESGTAAAPAVTPTTQAAGEQAQRAEVERLKHLFESGGAEPVTTVDSDNGSTIGQAPNQLIVPPDAARMPLPESAPSTASTP